jgi:hypothetical protein
MKKEEMVKVVLLTAFMAMAIEPSAFAITAPAAGSFAYDIYDMAVNSILKGPIGFVAGLGAVCFGAVLAIQQKMGGAIPALLGGAALLKADSIVASMGLLY